MLPTTIDLGSEFLQASRDDGVLRVVINRPARKNALTLDMYAGLARAAVLADAEPGIDVLLLTGVGDVFCAGGDLGSAGKPAADRREPDPHKALPFEPLERCSKIVISAINGSCQAGGVVLALCSDIVVASERATFRVPELLRGIADTLISARLPRQIGTARAKYLMFTAESIDAREAERIGLVARVVPADEFDTEVARIVERVQATAPAARAALKRDVNAQLPPFDWGPFTASMRSAEVAEGARAFIEKRPPRWPR